MELYDIIVIGGGPAGCAASVYAGRKRLNTLLITESIGGQSVVSASIENWIGDVSISGIDLAKKFEEHVRAQETVTIQMPERVVSVKEAKDGCLLHGKQIPCYEVETEKGMYKAKAVIVTSGARRRRLGIPGEDTFDGKGVAFCSTCDAPVFNGKDVAVIGGGNAGLEAVTDLLPYAKNIYLLERSDQLKGDTTTVEQIKEEGKDRVSILFHAQAKEVLGDKLVTGLVYTDLQSNQDKKLDVQGMFVEIGSVPNSDIVKDLVDINKHGEIIINHATGETSRPGIYAAGDVTDDVYKQNNISVGEGVAALLSAYNYLLNLKKESPAAG